MANSRPQYSFVLIGQVFGRDIARSRPFPTSASWATSLTPISRPPSQIRCLHHPVPHQSGDESDRSPSNFTNIFRSASPWSATNMAELSSAANCSTSARMPRISPTRSISPSPRKTGRSPAPHRIREVQHLVEPSRGYRSRDPRVLSAGLDFRHHPQQRALRPPVSGFDPAQHVLPGYEVILVDNASTD